MTTTLIHVHASTAAKPIFVPSSAHWFRRNIDYWVGETIQNQGQKIRFCWTKAEENANRDLYNSIKHQIFMMTMAPIEKRNNSLDYNGFVVFTNEEKIYHNHYIIFSNGDNQELWQELEEYDDTVEKNTSLECTGIFIDLNDLNCVTTWYDDEDDDCLY